MSEVAHQVSAPWRLNPLLAGVAIGSQPGAAPSRNGLLLLLGAAALCVVALASASMLRLLHRMDEVRWS